MTHQPLLQDNKTYLTNPWRTDGGGGFFLWHCPPDVGGIPFNFGLESHVFIGPQEEDIRTPRVIDIS